MNRLELLLELKHNFQVYRKELSSGSLLILSLSFIYVFNTINQKMLIEKVAKSYTLRGSRWLIMPFRQVTQTVLLESLPVLVVFSILRLTRYQSG